MTQTRVGAIALVLALGVGSCAPRARYNPYKVSKEGFRSRIRTIALTSVVVPPDLEDPGPVKAKFESLIDAKLRAAGFSVVPSRELVEIWDRTSQQAGGYFDPVTGRRDEAKFKVVLENVRRELGARFHADAVLHPSIRVTKAAFSDSTARWDGASESIKSTGTQVLEAIIGLQSSGSVPALSLLVAIEDMNGADLYVDFGGIQVLSKVSRGQFVRVARQELFVDEGRNSAAVGLALDALMVEQAGR